MENIQSSQIPQAQSVQSKSSIPSMKLPNTPFHFPKIVLIVIVVFIIVVLGITLYILLERKMTPFNTKSGTLTTLLNQPYNFLVNGSYYYHNCILSPDGYHTACLKYTHSTSGSTDTLVMDGKEKNTFKAVGGISDLQFTADDKIAYIAQKNGQKFPVIDGKEGNSYPFVGNFAFSNDGNHYAFCVGTKSYTTGTMPFTQTAYKNLSMFLDGKKLRDFAFNQPIDVNSCVPIFSPNGNHIAYAMKDNGKNLMILDDKDIFSSTNSTPSIPVFSGDGTKIYFILHNQDNNDNKTIPTLIDLSGKIIKTITTTQIVYDPYGNFQTDYAGDKLLWIGSETDGGAESLFINDRKINESSSIWNPSLSQSGSKLIYTSIVEGNRGVMIGDESTSPVAHVIFDDKEIDNYRTFDTRVSPAVFSQNETYVAYLSDTLATNSRLNIDPTLSKLVIANDQKVCDIPFTGIPLGSTGTQATTAELAVPIFSPDGEHIGFGYMSGSYIMWGTGKINMDNCSLDDQN